MKPNTNLKKVKSILYAFWDSKSHSIGLKTIFGVGKHVQCKKLSFGTKLGLQDQKGILVIFAKRVNFSVKTSMHPLSILFGFKRVDLCNFCASLKLFVHKIHFWTIKGKTVNYFYQWWGTKSILGSVSIYFWNQPLDHGTRPKMVWFKE